MTEQGAHPAAGRAKAAVALAALVLTLAACAGGTGGSPTSPPANGSSGPAGGVAVTDSQGPSASCGNPAGAQVGAVGGPLASVLGAALCGMADIDPCSMLNQADVQALFSEPLGTSTTDHTGDCTWPLSDPNKGDGLDIVVNVGEGEGPLDTDMGLSDTTPISGIGDKAMWGLLAGYFPHLGAVKGNATCELSAGSGGDGQLNVPTTGQGEFAKIDAAALPGFLQKFGGLCNEIFAALEAKGLSNAGGGAAATSPGDSGAGSAPSGAATGPAMGHVGDKLTFAEFGGVDSADATLVKVFDPATPTDASTQALPTGARWVGVEIVIDNHSPNFQEQGSEVDGVTSDGSTITTDDVYQSASRPIGSFAGCTQTDGSEQDVQPYTHCEAFVVPDGQTLTQVGVKVGGAEIGSSLVPADQAVWAIP